MKKKFSVILIYVAVAGMLVLSLANISLLTERTKKVEEAKITAQEFARPATIQVIRLLSSDCAGCVDVETLVDSVRTQNVNITKEKTILFDSVEGKQLITKYRISSLPSLIISGEINKTEQLNSFFESRGTVIDTTALYTKINPPYYDISEGRVVGNVKITHIVDSSCARCGPLDAVEASLINAGVKIVDVEILEYNSPEGKELTTKFDIKEVPAMLISDEVDYYETIKNELIKLTGGKKNEYYIVHTLQPPYRDLEKDAIVGLVDLIFLSDESCIECYNVELNKNILERFGVAFDDINNYDIASEEGKKLIEKYNITKAPIIIVSPEAAAYNIFVKAWEEVGSVEEDGWYIMREPAALGNYKDLTTETVVKR